MSIEAILQIFNEANKIFGSYGDTCSCIFMIKFRHILLSFYYPQAARWLSYVEICGIIIHN